MTEATPRPWRRTENGDIVGPNGEAIFAGERPGFDERHDNDAARALAAVNTYDERDALLREAEKLYDSLDAVIPPHEFERFEKYEIEFSGEAINELRATLARIRKALGETA